MKSFIDRVYLFVERAAVKHRLGRGTTPIPVRTHQAPPVLPPVAPQVAASLASWENRHVSEAQRAFMASLAPRVWTRAFEICRLRLWREKGLTDWNLAAADAYQMLLQERYRLMLSTAPGKPLADTDFTQAENAHPQALPVVAPDPATLTRIGRHMTGPHRTLRLVCPVPAPEEQHDSGEPESGINDDTEESPAIVILKHMAYTG